MNGLQLREIIPPHIFPNNPFPGTINGSMWTISYEFWCYIGIMMLGLCGCFRRFRWIPVALLVILWYCFARGLEVPFPGPLAPVKHIAFFVGSMDVWPRFATYYLFGTCFFLFRHRIPMRWEIAIVAALVVFVCIAINVFPAAFFAPALCYLTLWAACQPYLRFPNFAKYGDFSYGIYLYAFPIQQILVALFPGRFTPWTLFAAAATLSVIAGAMSWHLVEKRFLLRVRGRVSGPHVHANANPQPSA
jgi:peptidoglycan/LPS O-acetylase OafA/YrhL